MREQSASPRVSVLIVNYRSYDELALCLQSLSQHEPEAEVIVVDWETQPASLDGLRKRHPDTLFLAQAGNLGFGAGVNLAARRARGEWLLLLNPDARLEQPVLAVLQSYASSEAGVGIVGPRILEADGRIQASARRFPGASALLGGRSTWLTRHWPSNPLSRFNLLATETDAVRPVDWVSGACMLVRRTVFESVGGFDERFFLYWEDADLCRRLSIAGWRTVYHPGAVVRHATARSSRHTPTRSLVAFHSSAFRYFRKHARSPLVTVAPLVWLILQLRLALLRVIASRRAARTILPFGRPIRVLRIVSRLNIGGPTIHVSYLARLTPGFEAVLVAGHENPGEGSMLDFVRDQGVEPVVLPELVGDGSIGLREVRALWKLVRIVRRFRPDIIDTHTAKAGFIGRLAGVLMRVPVRIHTFHGHVLHGYYRHTTNVFFRFVEKVLAMMSTRLVAVSEGVKHDLVVYGVAAPSKIAVVPLGLDLDPYLGCDRLRTEFRQELGLTRKDQLVGIVGRLYPIKNHALFIDAAVRVAAVCPRAYFVVVGDGVLLKATRARAAAAGLSDRVIFTGWRRDLPRVYADLDLLAVASNNEGTPFAAIEAMAAGVPVIGTRVGGMADLIKDRCTGRLVPSKNAVVLAEAIAELLGDEPLRHAMGRAARQDMAERYGLPRLLSDTEALYADALAAAGIVR